MATGSTSASGALAGVRVVDCTVSIGGRAAAMLLADHGAEVVRVATRPTGPPAWSPTDLALDRNKIVVHVDGVVPADCPADVRRLVNGADVFVADSVPGDLDRLGLDAATLRSQNPGLVHAWLPPYGSRGRWSYLPADPLLLAAVAGPSAHHPASQDVPVTPVVPSVAFTQGAMGAAAVVAGLVVRQRTGQGRSVTVSGLHAVGAQQRAVMIRALDVARMLSPGKSLRGGANFRMYQGSDGRWFHLAALSGGFFIGALEAIDQLDLLLLPGIDGEFSNLLVPENGARVGAELEAVFAAEPSTHWIEVLRAASVPVAPVRTRAEWAASEVVAANRMKVAVEHPTLGQVDCTGVAVHLSRTPGRVRWLPSADHRRSAGDGWLGSEPPAPSEKLATPRLPLDGITVLDLSSFLAAPISSSLLADYGATVIKIESSTGDAYRLAAPAFDAVNHAKKSLVLDLRSTDGRQGLLDLIRHADVMVDNLLPASWERLGLDHDIVAAANPRLVWCSVSAYGRDSIQADEPGFDPVFQSLSGMAAAQGGDGDPVASAAPVVDVATGSLAAFGILLALFERGRSGVGQHVFTSLAAGASFVQSVELMTYAGSPEPAKGGRDFPGPTAGHRLYQVADGWVAIAATTDDAIHRLLAAVGRPEWSDFVDASPADAPRDGPLAQRIAEALAGWETTALIDALAARDVTACRVLDRSEELDDAWLAENGFFHLVGDSALGRIQAAHHFADWNTEAELDPPLAPVSPLGGDSRAVLRQAGFSSERINKLLAAND